MKTEGEIEEELSQWEVNLKKVVRTTGRTNFAVLKEDTYFKRLFPLVTEADGFVINRLLKNMKKYREVN